MNIMYFENNILINLKISLFEGNNVNDMISIKIIIIH